MLLIKEWFKDFSRIKFLCLVSPFIYYSLFFSGHTKFKNPSMAYDEYQVERISNDLKEKRIDFFKKKCLGE